MDYVRPIEVLDQMVKAGATKAALPIKDLIIRGFLSGALLGFATSLAIGATVQTGVPLVGALVFPVGFVIIVLLGLELVTGSFAVVPLAWHDGEISASKVASNLAWVFAGNLIGSLFYALLLAGSLTMMGKNPPDAVGAKIIAIAEAKTLGFSKFGMAGTDTVFIRAVLCNWMVTLGVVMGLASTSTFGKIAAMWLPILIFFAQGFEHSVVNMFVIPAGMLMGAKVSLKDWWLSNQIPVTLGNFVGGYVFTGLALYCTLRQKKAVVATVPEKTALAKPGILAGVAVE